LLTTWKKSLEKDKWQKARSRRRKRTQKSRIRNGGVEAGTNRDVFRKETEDLDYAQTEQ
jgi:hypothetical protein